MGCKCAPAMGGTPRFDWRLFGFDWRVRPAASRPFELKHVHYDLGDRLKVRRVDSASLSELSLKGVRSA